VTRELLDQGLLRVAERAPSSGGRPALLLEIVGAAATAFGVKVAPDHLVGVRVNLDSDVLERYEEPLDSAAPDAPERIADALARWLAGDGAADFPPLLGVGLGVPGISHELGKSVDSPMLGWRDLPLATQLEERIGVPVLVDNDVNTLALSEHLYGRGRNLDSFVTVTIGRGVGAAVVANGQLVRGRGGAAELGHVPVDPAGPLCECGNRGCLEAFAADPALLAAARAARLVGPEAGIEDLRDLARGGDAAALALFADAGARLGRAVAMLVALFDPELVLLSGEGTASWPYLGPAFDSAYDASAFPPLRDVPIEIDPWDDLKWARGAAALVLQAPFTDAAGQVSRVRERLVRGSAAA
jgi:predicted NBD/HSP70 family sugar kinase